MVRLQHNSFEYGKFFSMCFNSIMVRLQHEEYFISDHEGFCFNSIMVRLQPLARNWKSCMRFLFQFHHGTITTLVSSMTIHLMRSFNSIMVRLNNLGKIEPPVRKK